MVYRFPGPPATGDAVGTGPNGGLATDSSGNVYGTTPYSGAGGEIYEVTAASKAITLYSFPGAASGTFPSAGLTRDSTGSLYGVAGGGAWDAGVLFRLDANGQETVLYSFTGGSDGAFPVSNVVLDAASNVYGTTKGGGASNQGVVFKVNTSGTETVLHSFTGGADGGLPNGVVIDSQGNLYGTTFAGGEGSRTGAQEGVVFMLDPTGNETVLYNFTGLSDGGAPTAGVIRDAGGNLYGTTNEGGLGFGVIYKVDPAGQETVLYTFTGGADGGAPLGGLIFGPDGGLFGTTNGYGAPPEGEGEGVVFELEASGQYTVLYTFNGEAGGGFPYAGVVRDAEGNLYGTTYQGGGPGCAGFGCGVVFEVHPGGQEIVLHAFTGYADGGNPAAGLALGPGGGLYGTTTGGGLGAFTWRAPSEGFGGGGVAYSIGVQ